MADPLPPHWFQILLSLTDRPMHGLAITDDVSARTGGRLYLWPGVLYVALRKMAEAGLIAETDPPADFVATAGKARFFKLTPVGRRACADEAAYLAGMMDSAQVKKVLKTRTR